MSVPAPTDRGIDFVEEFATAADWFAASLGLLDLRAPVPSCPGWSVYDLAVHLGNVHSWAATIVETGRPTADQHDAPDARRQKAVTRWYVAKAEDLYEVLRTCDPSASCWNFAFGSGAASFWRRRQMHETLMHGVDLALAAGMAPQVRPSLAVDGIDETLRVFLHRMHLRGHPADLVSPVALVATDDTDTAAAWTVMPRGAQAFPSQVAPHTSAAGAAGPPEPAVVHGAAPGIDRVEAPAAVLLQVLWKRRPVSDPQLRVVGDARRVGRFLASRLTS